MKRWLTSLLCLCLVSVAVAQVNNIQNIKARRITSLNGKWHYIIDPFNTGDNGRFYFNKTAASSSDLVEYNFETSPVMNVPGDWNSQNEKLQFYEGTVWYEKSFNATLVAGKKYFISFGAVNYAAEVYLNGRLLGTHSGGFTPFQFDVTDKILDGYNSLVVRVNNQRSANQVPSENYDWWNYGGITRDVLLAEMPETYVSDYSIQLSQDDPNSITGFVQLDGPQLSQFVTVQILEANLQIKIATNAIGRATFIFPVKNLTLWTPEKPQVYTIKIITETDTTTDRIGFRTVQTKGNSILLNGKPVFLRGICMHNEDPLIPGRPRSDADIKMMLNWAKELNCNFVRLAHYPHNEEVSRLADEMGIMLWEEIPVYWNINWLSSEANESARNQLTELIGRDKNRASVIIWSIGNETPNTPDRNKFMENLADQAKRLDTTRLITAALLGYTDSAKVFHINDPLASKLDVLSFNEYLGWYEDTPDNIPNYGFDADMGKPVIISETGGGALAGYHAADTVRWSEEFQDKIYKNQLAVISKIKGLSGITPWILADFKSPKRLNPQFQDYWNRKGLISDNGKKKMAFYTLQQFYNTKAKQ